MPKKPPSRFTRRLSRPATIPPAEPARNLTEASKRIFAAVMKEYELAEADISVLVLGLEHHDLASASLAQCRKEGVLLPGTTKTNPATAAAKHHTQAWLSCVKTLGIHLSHNEDEE